MSEERLSGEIRHLIAELKLRDERIASYEGQARKLDLHTTSIRALAAEMAPCSHEKAFRKTVTTDTGIVFVCETCSHHWYRTYAQINAVETSAQSEVAK